METGKEKTAHGRQVERVLWIVLVLNLVVAASKYFYGLASGIGLHAGRWHPLGIRLAGQRRGARRHQLGGASCRRGAPLRPFQVRDLRFARHRRAAPLRRLRSRLLGCGASLVAGTYTAQVTPVSFVGHGGNPRGEPVRDLVRAPRGQAAQERDPRGGCGPHALRRFRLHRRHRRPRLRRGSGSPWPTPSWRCVVTVAILASAVGVFRTGLRHPFRPRAHSRRRHRPRGGEGGRRAVGPCRAHAGHRGRGLLRSARARRSADDGACRP